MLKQKRILVFSGGNVGDWALSYIQPDDVIVGVDRGALFLVQHGIQADMALGDFDSVSNEELAAIENGCRSFLSCDPIMKDLTDTEMAFNWALEQQPVEVLVLGGLGTRFDHTLANVHLLMRGLQANIFCRMVDDRNEVCLMRDRLSITKDRFTHVSLLPLSMQVTGITLDGFQYPLHEAILNIGDSLGISNVLVGEAGTIEIKSGYLLVIKSKD